jgi:hypothetical protein
VHINMMTIEALVQDNVEGKKRLTDRIVNRPDSITSSVFLNLWFCEESFATHFLKELNFQNAKASFNNCMLLDFYRLNKYNERFFDYGLHHISYALLSDNETLIQRYAKLRYQRGANAELSMDEMVAIGELPIWCNTVQFFMAIDNEGVERNLNIIETKTLKSLPKKEEGLKDDYEFYIALHAGDKAKMEEVLEKLVSPKIHKKRNDNPVLNQYISLPALGYAKLAWRKGFEVEVKSDLVPKALLPIEPLAHYEIPYDFLKENS